MNNDQRDITRYVIVGAKHPVVGPIFWCYCDESDVNAPNYYGLTTSPEHAARIPAGWRNDRNLIRGRGYRDLYAYEGYSFLNTLLDEFRIDSEYRTDFDDEEQFVVDLTGSLEELRLQSGQSAEDFIRWIWTVEWLDEPAVCMTD